MAKASILIVDDEHIVLLDIQNTLENNGFQVVGHATRGEDAVQKAQELRPDLILMDIGLKGEMDGIQAAAQIRKSLDLPVIFLTAFGNPSIIERARIAEPYGYIIKPFEEKELVSNIEMAIYKHSMEKKLRESENKFRRIVEYASDGIALLDPQGHVIEWNPAIEQITGLKRDHTIGQMVWEVIFEITPTEKKTAEFQEKTIRAWAFEIEHGFVHKDHMMEYEIESVQGIRRIVQSNGFTIDTDAGILGGVVMRDITERRKIEEAIANREKRFRALIEHGRDNISLLTVDGTLLWESPSALHTLGYKAEEFVGKNIFQLMHTDDKTRVENLFAQVIQNSGNSQEGVFRLLHANGAWLWIEATATNLLHEPEVQAIVINYRDITIRKNAEEALRRSESLFQQAIEVAGAVPYHQVYRENGSVEYDFIGEGIQLITGYRSDEFSERLWDSLVQERILLGDLAGYEFDEAILQVRSGKLPIWKCEHRIRTRDGQSRWVLEAAVEQRDETGSSYGSIGMFQDITDRKLAEVELRKLSQAVEQSANTIVITDIDGTIQYANPKFVETTGYALEDVLGKTPRVLKSSEHNLEFYQNLWQTIKAGNVWRGEFHNRRKDGSLYWEDTTISPVYDTAHNLVSFIAVKEDITIRKALQESEQYQRQLADALRNTSAALNSTLKLDEVLDRVLDNVDKIVIYDAAMVLLIEDHENPKIRQRSKLIQSSSAEHPILTDTQINLINIPILRTVLETRRPCVVNETQGDSRWYAVSGMRWVHSLISSPIEIRGRVVGLITLLSAEPNFFTPIHSERLMAYASQVAIAIENAQLFEQAYFLSITDPLTGLSNRRHFFDAANQEFERVRRYGRMLSIMLIDVDHFKTINDTYGHAVGDQALHEIARRIVRSVRDVDIVARYGGEEFIVLMPETTLQKATQAAERIRKMVADSPIQKGNMDVSASLSIGVTQMDATSKNMDQLITYADRALYAAKAAGRNQVASYPTS